MGEADGDGQQSCIGAGILLAPDFSTRDHALYSNDFDSESVYFSGSKRIATAVDH